ncbi:Ras suppressor protein 1 [Podila verticillata]|nr:Ras suppressor protein 1 [Podila verticillata]
MLKDVTVEEIMTECCEPQIAILDFNLLTSFPIALHHAFGTTTLTQISIHHNKISEFPLQLSFPFLVSLNLSDNLITTLSGSDGSDESATIGANFPKLNELQISGNKLTEIPVWMPKAFPALQSLNASRNKITALDPVSFTGLQFLDLSSNDIGSLPPLLGNVRTIKSLNLDGNLFRVPRRQVMEQGTEAIMEYLRDRIPA